MGDFLEEGLLSLTYLAFQGLGQLDLVRHLVCKRSAQVQILLRLLLLVELERYRFTRPFLVNGSLHDVEACALIFHDLIYCEKFAIIKLIIVILVYPQRHSTMPRRSPFSTTCSYSSKRHASTRALS